jgi:hypothetical protein
MNPYLGDKQNGLDTVADSQTSNNSGVGSLLSLEGLVGTLLQPSGIDNAIDSLGLGSLFGQTSFDTIKNEGAQIVAAAFSLFNSTVKTNPSDALTVLSKELIYQRTRRELMILNSSSNRTVNGHPISLKAIQDGILKIEQVEKTLSKLFTISKTPINDSFHFKITKEYTYYKYNLVVKKEATNKDLGFQTDGLKSNSETLNSVNTEDAQGVQSANKSYLLIALLPFGLLFIGGRYLYKKLKK